MSLGGEFVGLLLLGDLESSLARALAALLQHLESLQTSLLIGKRRALDAFAIGQCRDTLNLIVDRGIELAHEVLVDTHVADVRQLQPGLGRPLTVLEAVAFEHAKRGVRAIGIALRLCRDAGHAIAFPSAQLDQQRQGGSRRAHACPGVSAISRLRSDSPSGLHSVIDCCSMRAMRGNSAID